VTGQTEKLALNGASRTARNGADEKQLCVRGNLDSDGAEQSVARLGPNRFTDAQP
jgi:hypothetical protein